MLQGTCFTAKQTILSVILLLRLVNQLAWKSQTRRHTSFVRDKGVVRDKFWLCFSSTVIMQIAIMFKCSMHKGIHPYLLRLLLFLLRFHKSFLLTCMHLEFHRLDGGLSFTYSICIAAFPIIVLIKNA